MYASFPNRQDLTIRDEIRLSAIARNLGNFVDLDDDDRISIKPILSNSQRVPSNQILFHERSCCDHIALIEEGLACRYKTLPDGRRQILGYLIPGDLCDISFLISGVTDYGVAVLGDSRISSTPIHQFAEILQSRPNVARGVSLAGLRDTVILREWLLNIGRRNALQRLCHFFCEVSLRMHAVGQSRADGSIDLPVNQGALADTVGLTQVHLNRTLQRLRGLNLIDFHGRRLQIVDFSQLAQLAQFDDYYLGLRTRR